MQIDFRQDEQHLQELLEVFNQFDPEESLFMNHHMLAKETGIGSDKWKEFLTHPKVSTYQQTELALFKDHQLKLMIKDSTDDKRSVGAAQMMNALMKVNQETNQKEGAVIIYTYVPLTQEQQASPVEYVVANPSVLPTDWED